MAWLVHITTRFIRVIQHVYERKWLFLAFALVIFLSSEAFLARADLLPQTPPTVKAFPHLVPKVTLQNSPLVAENTSLKTHKVTPVHELPVRVNIPTIHLSVTVSNPNTTSIRVLDKALLTGAVRYPLSATLGEKGNVIIFGHSSYLPVVYNQAYKTFDGIQKLKRGEHILISSKTMTYVYSVDTVSKEDVSAVAIPLNVSGSHLTLSTCDSFGTKSDRFVVTAHLVDSYPRKI